MNSYFQNAPAAGNVKNYDVLLSPAVSGVGGDNQLVLSFDIMSFDPSDDENSLILLNAVIVAETNINQ